MLHIRCLVPAVFAVGSVLMCAGAVQAQRGGGGGHSGGGHSGGGSSSGGHAAAFQGSTSHGGYLGGGYSNGAFSGSAHSGGSGHHSHHDGYNIGGYYGGGPFYGGGTGYFGGLPYSGAGGSSAVPYSGGGGVPYSGVPNGGYAPSSPSLYQPSGSARFSAVAPESSSDDVPAMPSEASKPVVEAPAKIEVIVSDPQARVFFDGALTQLSGTNRLFTTPPLTASGAYRIRASWIEAGREVIQEKLVTVAPNQSTVVDFTQPSGG
jgi:uncharacterized protein (TIGR03000 family)